jgi:hypothetical protein
MRVPDLLCGIRVEWQPDEPNVATARHFRQDLNEGVTNVVIPFDGAWPRDDHGAKEVIDALWF